MFLYVDTNKLFLHFYTDFKFLMSEDSFKRCRNTHNALFAPWHFE
jgi:hypothetical protein